MYSSAAGHVHVDRLHSAAHQLGSLAYLLPSSRTCLWAAHTYTYIRFSKYACAPSVPRYATFLFLCYFLVHAFILLILTEQKLAAHFGFRVIYITTCIACMNHAPTYIIYPLRPSLRPSILVAYEMTHFFKK
jgi:hypothetical protein